MATLNQAKIIKGLEKLTNEVNPQSFFFDFLKTYGFANSTIKKLESNDKSRNIALRDGDYGLAKQIYFRPVKSDSDVSSALDELIDNPILQKQQVRFFITTDFQQIATYDRRVDDRLEFELGGLRDNFDFFLPLTGQYEKPVVYSSHPADVKACEKMGRLYDIVKVLNHYDSNNLHSLNIFLTRLLFCFFAEDTGIFPIKSQMTNALTSMTAKDGHDLPEFFDQLFDVLDLPEGSEKRNAYPSTLKAFPYVNGGLFKEKIQIPVLNTQARNILLDCGRLTWSDISPVIFGSMFQSVMNPEERHEIGAHYTSEKNIFKVIAPLFLDDLKEEFSRITALKTASDRRKKLQAFQNKLASLKFLDPACGCGNFLIVAYRELKLLELEVAKQLYANSERLLDMSLDEKISQVSIDQFYGIELLEFPVEVARVSMWLMEHVMNLRFGEQFGAVFPSIPLKKVPQIVCANALTTDWRTVVNPQELNFIMGNPPFVGYKFQTTSQKTEIKSVAGNLKNYGTLDYVSCWYIKALDMIKETNTHVAFVSTNSVSQGEHVCTLWKPLTEQGLTITFAHRTFKWSNEAKANATVHCVIIGFKYGNANATRIIFDEDGNKRVVRHINGYLLDASDVYIDKRSKPWGKSTPKATKGNAAMDNGFLTLSSDQRQELISKHPALSSVIRRYMSADDFLYSQENYCFWFKDVDYSKYEAYHEVQERVSAVQNYRYGSDRKATKKMAEYPMLFAEVRQSKSNYMMIPVVSSERRQYLPIGFLTPDIINSYASISIPNASLYDFGVLSSRFHNIWIRAVCGRLEMRYRYATSLVYNTFPWPDVTEPQKKLIENLANNILMTREFYPDMTLADLYDPDKMPDDLRKAHQELDIAVDKLYRRKPFQNDEQRLKHLFGRYEKLIKGEDSSTLFDEE